MAVSFRHRLLDDFLKEWQLRKKQLREGEITKEEYLEWKLNWPQTADGCGRYEPKKKWRKVIKDTKMPSEKTYRFSEGIFMSLL